MQCAEPMDIGHWTACLNVAKIEIFSVQACGWCGTYVKNDACVHWSVIHGKVYCSWFDHRPSVTAPYFYTVQNVLLYLYSIYQCDLPLFRLHCGEAPGPTFEPGTSGLESGKGL